MLAGHGLERRRPRGRDTVGTPTAARSLAEVLWRIAVQRGSRGTHHWSRSTGTASCVRVRRGDRGGGADRAPREVTVTPIAHVRLPDARAPAVLQRARQALARASRADPCPHWRQRLRGVLKEMARS